MATLVVGEDANNGNSSAVGVLANSKRSREKDANNGNSFNISRIAAVGVLANSKRKLSNYKF